MWVPCNSSVHLQALHLYRRMVKNGGKVTSQKVALWPTKGQEPLKREEIPRKAPGITYAQVNCPFLCPHHAEGNLQGKETGLADV